jgi:tRNA-splicing ligase RtcB
MAGVSTPKGKIPLVEDAPYIYRIPREVRKGMRVDGIVFASPALIGMIEEDPCLEQVCHVACLPGIVQASIAMPDIHWGYGFPIGGVAAMDPEEGGVVSPGGVGYDINCGVRLLRTPLTYEEVKPRLDSLVDALFREVPAGVGKGGNFPFRGKDLDRLLENGVDFLLEKGLARKEDALHCEAGGHLEGADPRAVSETARERGWDQCGTLGSGNHFLEVQVVDRVEDPETARILGLEPGMVCVMIHSGSRGLGHQVCEDTLKVLRKRVEAWGYDLPDRQLACAPIRSPEGERYLMAMRSAANFAWCNRQLITEEVRTAFSRIFGKGIAEKIEVVYDVAHNIAKFEEHEVEGKKRLLLVHRKGATRAFPPNHPEVPLAYRKIGQPVLIPGDMGRASWVLRGAERSMELSFGTSCHGAGRRMSRTQAVKSKTIADLKKEMAKAGVVVRGHTDRGLLEEQPHAYKDVDEVVEVVHGLGISFKVARLKPIGVIKG